MVAGYKIKTVNGEIKPFEKTEKIVLQLAENNTSRIWPMQGYNRQHLGSREPHRIN